MVLYMSGGAAAAAVSARPLASLGAQMAPGAPRTGRQIAFVSRKLGTGVKMSVNATVAAFKVGHTSAKFGLAKGAPPAKFLGRSGIAVLKSPGARATGRIVGRSAGFIFKKVLLPWAIFQGVVGAGRGVQQGSGIAGRFTGGVVGGVSGFTGIPKSFINKVLF